MKFNEMSSKEDLANVLEVPVKFLNYILYGRRVENCYDTFLIPKKSGGHRVINAPKEPLKSLQKKLSKKLWEYELFLRNKNHKVNTISHAFEPKYDYTHPNGEVSMVKKTIISNAKVHRNKKYVLNVDLEDFFGSFHFGRVKGFFERNKNYELPTEVSLLLAQLTCYQGELPQGAPTSPILTNMICQILDFRLSKLAKLYKLNYTRYADDLTFSTNDKKFLLHYDDFFEKLNSEIIKAGFSLNEKKTRLQYRQSRQSVTGLTVNQKISVPREYYKLTKAMAHRLYQGKEMILDRQEVTINVLSGRFAFIDQIDIENNKLDGKKHGYSTLNAREKEYQKFLFYKTFFAHSKPLLVTEGKTDEQHIKAALKSFYEKEPEKYMSLVGKTVKDGKEVWEFKVRFLRRTKKLHYLLNISQDGGDALRVIADYYKNKTYNSKSSYPNYFAFFTKLSPSTVSAPVILIPDNEPSKVDANGKAQNSPLKSLFPDKKELEKFAQNGHSLCLKDNIYVVSFELPVGMTNAEIEDLYDPKLLNTEIDGRRFDRTDKNGGYSKAIFADYIGAHYKDINFENFRGLIDNIVNIISEYRMLEIMHQSSKTSYD